MRFLGKTESCWKRFVDQAMNEGAICSSSLSSDASATNWWACAEPPQDLQEVPEGMEKWLFPRGVHASTSIHQWSLFKNLLMLVD